MESESSSTYICSGGWCNAPLLILGPLPLVLRPPWYGIVGGTSLAGFSIKAVFDGPAGEVVRPDRNKIFHGHGIHRLAEYTAETNNGPHFRNLP